MPRLPQDELTQYLARQRLAPDQVSEIQARYAQAIATADAATWSRDRTFEWLDEQVEIIGEAEAVSTDDSGGASATSASIAAMAQAAGRAAERATMAADERGARVRASASPEFVYDAGPSMDPNRISTSLAVGYWVDERGNAIDPNTGQPLAPGQAPFEADAASIWEQIRGQKFNMGTLSMPGVKERRTANYRPVRRGFTGTEPGTPSAQQGGLGLIGALAGPEVAARLGARPQYDLNQTRVITPSQAMALLGSMDENYLTKLQQGMWDAGLYAAVGEGARPDWGKADPVTRKAFQQLFIEASLDPEAPIQQVLADLAQRNILNLGDVPGAPGSSTGQAPDFRPEVASEETLGQLIDELGQNLLGEYVDEGTKKSLIERLQAKEIETQRQAYEQELSQFNTSSASGVPGMEDIDVFMNAIAGLESGGDYTAQNASGAYGKFQIMPSNWAPWATRAGLGPGAPRTPQNQEIVAKRIMMDYYAQFGNWRDVAIAWFAGPDNVGKAEGGSDGNMTIRDYANSILDRMASMKGGAGGDMGAAAGREFGAIERFDPAAEAEAALKAANPDAWVGHQWGNRAVEYFNLLQGVV